MKGKRIVLTGASSGIGRAVALRLMREEAHLHLLGRSEAALLEVARQARTWGASAQVCPLDLTQDEAVRACAAGFEGPIDALIHSAGTVSLGPLEGADIRDLDAQYRLNVRAPYLLTQLLLPQLTAARGHVVFLNSGAGLAARAGWGQYAASKHALKAVADALRQEVAGAGVRVTSLYPGRTASPMQARVHAQEGQPYDPARFVQPESVAELLLAALKLPESAEVTDLSVRPGPSHDL